MNLRLLSAVMAKRFGARVIQREPFPIVEPLRNELAAVARAVSTSERAVVSNNFFSDLHGSDPSTVTYKDLENSPKYL